MNHKNELYDGLFSPYVIETTSSMQVDLTVVKKHTQTKKEKLQGNDITRIFNVEDVVGGGTCMEPAQISFMAGCMHNCRLNQHATNP